MKYIPLFLFFLSQTLFAQSQVSDIAQSQKVSDKLAGFCDQLANPPPGPSAAIKICREGVERVKKLEAEGASEDQIQTAFQDTNIKMLVQALKEAQEEMGKKKSE